MKHLIMKIFLGIIIVLMLPVSLLSQPITPSWIGVYTQNHSETLPILANYCPFDGDLARVEIWIVCRPGNYGVMCTEFMLDYPDNVITSTSTLNESIITVSLGTLEEGISICFTECQTNLFCPIHQTVWINSHDHTAIVVVPHPDGSEFVAIANCEHDYPLEECIPIHALDLNYDDEYYGCTEVNEVVATQFSSWGVIKRLFDK